MVGTGLLAVGVLLGGVAQAQSLTLSPTIGVVGGAEIGARPGLRVGFEPVPAASLEVQADADFAGAWDTGLGLAGRAFFLSASDGEGLYLLGRFNTGISSRDGTIGSWTAISGGFGARPASVWFVEASGGPEWAQGAGWRTDLALGVVFGGAGIGSKPGQGSVRHRPREIPSE